MKAVILAGGLGSRLRPFTEIIPKPLLPIGEKAVLEIQIEHLKKHRFEEIFLATNYKSKYIQNFFGDGSQFGVKLMINKEEKPLGTAGPVALLKEHLTEPFIVMNGDVLSQVNFTELYDFAIKTDADLTVAVKEIVFPFAFGNVYSKGDFITGVEEKPDIKNTIIAGIYVFKPAIFDLIPEDTYFGMDLLIRKMLNEKMNVAKFEIKEYWLDIGQIDDYSKAQDIYDKHFKENS